MNIDKDLLMEIKFIIRVVLCLYFTFSKLFHVYAIKLFHRVLNLGYHGTSGPMVVSDLEKTPLVDVFLEAGKQIGCDVLDVNGQKQLGKHL